jgi:hypothetical protein
MAQPKNTGKFGKGNPGKPKGALNHSTKDVRAAILMVAEKLGGIQRMHDWATEDPDNEKLFWGSIYPKLLPKEIKAEIAATHVVQSLTPEQREAVANAILRK